jgi:hypothetical protein
MTGTKFLLFSHSRSYVGSPADVCARVKDSCSKPASGSPHGQLLLQSDLPPSSTIADVVPGPERSGAEIESSRLRRMMMETISILVVDLPYQDFTVS